MADNIAPIDAEVDLAGLTVRGELPPGLEGTLFRNGPNPQFPAAEPGLDHWFLGDGMVHAFTLEGGRASYRNRWVRTGKFRAEREAGRALGSGFGGMPAGIEDTGLANTHVVWHGGRLLALEEAHLPVELDPRSLATRGAVDFGRLHRPFTAHPKIDPVTGEMVFFGYAADGPFSPAMVWGTIGADGKAGRVERFEAPIAAMVHDFAVTRRHVVFPVLPLVGSLDRLRAGRMPYAWEPGRGAWVGVMARERGIASLRWIRTEPCFLFHVLNAWDAGGGADDRIVMDVCQSAAPGLFPDADGRPADPADAAPRLTRWTIDPEAGTVARDRLDGMPGEFPRIDDRQAGLPNRFGVFTGASAGRAGLDTVVRLDFAAGRRSAYGVPPGDGLSEAVFVPRGPSAAEGDGWLLAVAWRASERRSDLIVLEAEALADGPVAVVELPHRVPAGFHGSWVGAAD